MINGWNSLNSYFIAITTSFKTEFFGGSMGSTIRELRLDEGNQLDKPLVEAIFPLV